MDRQLFVQNIKLYCQLRGIKPTVACRESGAGPNLVNNIEAGSIPSVEKVQLLAQYLGVTTSELLGETGPKNLAIQDQPYLVMRYNSLSPEEQEKVMTFIDFLATQGKK
ncbi:XRE family transcriptional regulator [Colidextribacter sp. OB.20]|uniref:helix-turn-helix domain-containing protein n=1 Tax=Colidextribacter sp. OB.20 TaxID=2304568 RepID=UPI00136FB504|nr:helix-turn-helix transcriptional regulator [Colidextribacter sp. OB.20]NBI11871.1 XRE family transcriptional regulator [Colidextribacter sp. OB.20]